MLRQMKTRIWKYFLQGVKNRAVRKAERKLEAKFVEMVEKMNSLQNKLQ